MFYDHVIFSMLTDGYYKEGDVMCALYLHGEMLQKGILPDVVTYSPIINGLNKQARTKEAKRLLFKMLYDVSVQNEATYDALIGHCIDAEL